MPSVARITKKGSIPRSKTDFYPTRQEFADGHAFYAVKKAFSVVDELNILDVGVGGGTYGYAIRKAIDELADTSLKMLVDGIDVDLSHLPTTHPYTHLFCHDFLDFGGVGYDLIIGNPPYYEIQAFFEKAISMLNDGGIVSFLVKASYLESAVRYKWFQKHNPVSIWQAVNRPIAKHAESYVVVNYSKKPPLNPTKYFWLLSNKKERSFT